MFYSKQDVSNFKDLLYSLKRLAEDGVTELIEKQILLILDQALPFFTNLIMEAEFPEVHRLTINKDVIGNNCRIKDIKYLTYPPNDRVKTYGRCNLPGQSVFYGAFSWMTTLNEVRPRVGDLITHSVWRTKGRSFLRYSPIFKNQPSDGTTNIVMLKINDLYEGKVKDLAPYLKEATDLLLQFLSDAFTKRIDPKAPMNYIFSAYFSNKILYELDGGNIDGILYPSVHEKLSFENIAIKPGSFDEKYELSEVDDSVIVMDPSNGRGGYFTKGLSNCKDFDYSTGRIYWERSTINQSIGQMVEFKQKYGISVD